MRYSVSGITTTVVSGEMMIIRTCTGDSLEPLDCSFSQYEAFVCICKGFIAVEF